MDTIARTRRHKISTKPRRHRAERERGASSCAGQQRSICVRAPTPHPRRSGADERPTKLARSNATRFRALPLASTAPRESLVCGKAVGTTAKELRCSVVRVACRTREANRRALTSDGRCCELSLPCPSPCSHCPMSSSSVKAGDESCLHALAASPPAAAVSSVRARCSSVARTISQHRTPKRTSASVPSSSSADGSRPSVESTKSGEPRPSSPCSQKLRSSACTAAARAPACGVVTAASSSTSSRVLGGLARGDAGAKRSGLASAREGVSVLGAASACARCKHGSLADGVRPLRRARSCPLAPVCQLDCGHNATSAERGGVESSPHVLDRRPAQHALEAHAPAPREHGLHRGSRLGDVATVLPQPPQRLRIAQPSDASLVDAGAALVACAAPAAAPALHQAARTLVEARSTALSLSRRSKRALLGHHGLHRGDGAPLLGPDRRRAQHAHRDERLERRAPAERPAETRRHGQAQQRHARRGRGQHALKRGEQVVRVLHVRRAREHALRQERADEGPDARHQPRVLVPDREHHQRVQQLRVVRVENVEELAELPNAEAPKACDRCSFSWIALSRYVPSLLCGIPSRMPAASSTRLRAAGAKHAFRVRGSEAARWLFVKLPT
eukprot:6211410-Pleurochrysis_carterae.AAC.3